MNALKVYKQIAKRWILPLFGMYAAVVLLMIIGFFSFDDFSVIFEIISIAVAAVVAYPVMKTAFTTSTFCGASRKKSFCAVMLAALTVVLIIAAAHFAESIIMYQSGDFYSYRIDVIGEPLPNGKCEYVAVDETYRYILTDYVLNSLSFTNNIVFMWIMFIVKLLLAFFSGLAFFTIMSRLSGTGKLINGGVVTILIVLNVCGSALFSSFDGYAPMLSDSFLVQIVPHEKLCPVYVAVYGLLIVIAVITAYLSYRRKPVKSERRV